MPDSSPATPPAQRSSGPDPVQLVAKLCADQQRRWQAGDRVKVEHYLAEYPALRAEAYAIDLICHEFNLRQRHGLEPDPGDMFTRFPELATALTRQPLFQDAQGPATAHTQADVETSAATRRITSGTVLGEYVVIRLLGTGGMGEVFKALHQKMDRVVAVKVLSQPTVRTDSIDRFRREIKVAASLHHPHIVSAYDAGEFEGVHYLVMEYVSGETFTQLLRRGPISPELAVEYVIQAAQGLAYAHRQGVIHRDIKPGNLILSEGGVVKVLDMGIARLTQDQNPLHESGPLAPLTYTGAVLGTIDYMAPEQAEDSAQADQRSDIYSLGCTLYTLIVGRMPYEAETLVKRIIAHRQDPPPALRLAVPTVSRDLERVFRKMVAKRPEDRYQSMDAVIAALREALHPKPQWSRGVLVAGVLAAVAVAALLASPYLRPANPQLGQQQPVNPPPADPPPADPPPVDPPPVDPPPVDPPPVDPPKKIPPQPLPATFTAAEAETARTAWAQQLGVTARHQNTVGAELLLIPPGEFEMGSPDAEVEALLAQIASSGLADFWKQGLQSEAPRHKVTLTKPFYLSATEVTIGQFRQFVAATKYKTDVEEKGGGYGRVGTAWQISPEFNWGQIGMEGVEQWPVFNVTYRDATAFCTWLSEREKQTYRLPTEAEWEYACRAGTQTRWYLGDDPAVLGQAAWFRANSKNSPHPVGELKPNAFGLYDTLGNVWEWCADWHSYTAYQPGEVRDPQGPEKGTLRVIRGGSFYLDQLNVRAACRIWYGIRSSSGNIGFRLARDCPLP